MPARPFLPRTRDEASRSPRNNGFTPASVVLRPPPIGREAAAVAFAGGAAPGFWTRAMLNPGSLASCVRGNCGASSNFRSCSNCGDDKARRGSMGRLRQGRTRGSAPREVDDVTIYQGVLEMRTACVECGCEIATVLGRLGSTKVPMTTATEIAPVRMTARHAACSLFEQAARAFRVTAERGEICCGNLR